MSTAPSDVLRNVRHGSRPGRPGSRVMAFQGGDAGARPSRREKLPRDAAEGGAKVLLADRLDRAAPRARRGCFAARDRDLGILLMGLRFDGLGECDVAAPGARRAAVLGLIVGAPVAVRPELIGPVETG